MQPAETISVQQGIWIDRQRLTEAGLRDQVQITVQRGEIRIHSAAPDSSEGGIGAEEPLLNLAGVLSGAPLSAEEVEGELYGRPGAAAMNMEPTFVDTWGWLALGHRRDSQHSDVARLFRLLRSAGVPIYTSDYVLDEVITLLFRREVYEHAVGFVDGILAATDLGQLTVERVTPPRAERAAPLNLSP